MSVRMAWIATALVSSLLTVGCTPDGGDGDLLVITLDTFRADRVGAYGNTDGLTPNLDALAGRGVLFEQATAPTPITLPSHTGIFTGRHAHSTGVRNNGTFVVPESESTLAEVLSAAGWSTGAVVAAFPLQRRYGLDQGFDVYDDDLPEASAGGPELPVFFAERDAATVTDRAIGLWERLGPGRRMMWVHYFDPHAPYDPPEPWASRHEGAPYDGEIAYLDDQVGRLLASVADGGTLVAVVADHGEGLGDHDELTHGVFVYESTMRVPMMLAGAGLPEGLRLAEPVSAVDLTPTLLDLLGLETDDDLPLDGASLAGWLHGGPPPARPVYGESFLPRLQYQFSELRMLRSGDLKYIDAPLPELYDLRQDPAESRSLHGGHPDEETLVAHLRELVDREDPEASTRARGGLDPEAEKLLRSLGYAGFTSTDPSAGRERLRDPKTMTDYFRRYDRAIGLISRNRAPEAIGELEALSELAPENYEADYHLAVALFSADRHQEAEQRLEDLLQRAPEFINAHLLLGETRGRLGRLAAALEAFAAAAALAPTMAEPQLAAGHLLESFGRFPEAGERFARALTIEPGNREAGRRLVGLWSGRGAPELASAVLHELTEQHPNVAVLWLALAEASRAGGELAKARAAAERAHGLDPEGTEAALLLGSLLLEGGEPAAALDVYRPLSAGRPGDVRARFGLTRALFDLDRPEDARVELLAVLALEPDFSPVLTVQGLYLERQGQLDAARASYLEALRRQPADRQAREGLARLRLP